MDLIGWGVVNRIHLAQDRDQWKALMDMTINLLVLLNVGTFLLIAERLAASQEALGFMELVK
jgi:hypothetical protein